MMRNPTVQQLKSLLEFMLPGADIDWKRAACRADADPDAWFPFPAQEFEHAAKVCARCPLLDECGAFAAKVGESGVWGGHEYHHGQIVR